MENLKQPAYPLPLAIDSRDQHFDTTDYGKGNGGLTKLELASLMMAQGMLSGPHTYNGDPLEAVSTNAVRIAKAVLEEANK